MAKTNWQMNDVVLPSDLNDIGQEINDLQDESNQSAVDYIRQPAFATTAGTAGAYTITLNPAPTIISDGFGVTIVPHIANTTNPTLNINDLGATALKDQRGVAYPAGKLQAGKPYTFRKVGTDFLADSSGGSGDAIAGDIRAGKTATTDNGDVVGTLPIRTGGMVTPSTTNQTKQVGIYDSPIVVEGSSNLVAENIKKGITMFGVNGTMTPAPTSGYGYLSQQQFFLPAGANVQKSTTSGKDITLLRLYTSDTADIWQTTEVYGFGVGINGSAYVRIKSSNYTSLIDVGKVNANTVSITNGHAQEKSIFLQFYGV